MCAFCLFFGGGGGFRLVNARVGQVLQYRPARPGNAEVESNALAFSYRR